MAGMGKEAQITTPLPIMDDYTASAQFIIPPG